MKELISSKKFWTIFLSLILTGLALTAVLKYFKPEEKLKPKYGDVIESIYGLATVIADKVFRVRAGLPLSVQRLFVNEGDQVKSGDRLVQLDENILRSPIQGTITSISYKQGELVAPQTPIVTVTNLKKLYLEVSLEQYSVLRVQNRQTVYVSFESLRNEKEEGYVVSIYPRENQFIVRIQLMSWPQGVLPGMTADVAILVGKKANVLLIPIRSIVAGHVTVVRNNKKEVLPIKLGVVDGEWAEVISGNILENDELVIRK